MDPGAVQLVAPSLETTTSLIPLSPSKACPSAQWHWAPGWSIVIAAAAARGQFRIGAGPRFPRR